MIRTTIAAAMLLFPVSLPAVAQDYPTKPIEIIVPSSAGGSTDATARIFGEIAEQKFPGFKFVVQNVDGSGGQKGFEEIARAKPDGYTMGLVFTPQLVAHVAAGRAKYALDSFHVIGNVADDAGILAVPKDSPIKDVAGFTEAAKAGALTVAVNGIGSDDFLAAKAWEKNAGVTFNLLPTNGSTEQKAGVLGGHVDAAFMNVSQLLSQHKSGEARILAVLTTERLPALPDVPTAKEAGMDVEMRATRGFVTPKDVPADIQAKLDQVVTETVADPGFVEKSTAGGIDLLPMSGADYLTYLTDLQGETKAVFDAAPW